MPRSEDEALATVRAAVAHGVPVVPRGTGTGNYGQAVPLQGGVVLDLSDMNQVLHVDAANGTLRAQAGALLCDVEDAARAHGWELRQHPSTRRTATIGGFVAGGSTGHGALLHGGLAEDGAVLSLRVITAEDTPRILSLSGRDVFPAVHAYGTTGVITEVSIPLARAQPWHDAVASFSSLKDAAQFALNVGEAPAIVARAATVFESPVPSQFLPGVAEEFGTTLDRVGGHVTMVQCAEHSLGPLARLVADCGGELMVTRPAEESSTPMYEYGWNHTTLHALKVDKSITYLQAAMEPAKAVELVEAVQRQFDTNELMQHLEVVSFGGRVGFASLALLRPSSNERLREILDWHEANGIPVFDPHTHILEDGGMKETDYVQLNFKLEHDPNGILNPGKMRAWEEQAPTTAGTSTTAMSSAYARADSSSSSSSRSPNTTLEEEGLERDSAAPRSRFWCEWTTADFSSADLSEAVAVFPLGATEAHGPHLPLGVDSMHNAAIIDRALAMLPPNVNVLVLPPAEIGTSGEHRDYAGTLSLSVETASAAWREVGACVARAGIRKIVLFNSHGGNHALAEIVARQLRAELDMMAVLALDLDAGEVAAELFPGDELKFGIHGGDMETSVMLHLRPDLVHVAKVQKFASNAQKIAGECSRLRIHQPGFGVKCGWLSQDLNPNGVVGDASQACASKGSRVVDASAKLFAKLLEEVHAVRIDDVVKDGYFDTLYPPQGDR